MYKPPSNTVFIRAHSDASRPQNSGIHWQSAQTRRDIRGCRHCSQAGVGVSWDGRRVLAPSGVLDAEGFADLRPYL